MLVILKRGASLKFSQKITGINVVVLVPLALLFNLNSELDFLLTFAILIVVAIKFKAGITYK